MSPTRIPNEVGNRKALAGYQPNPDTEVNPTFMLTGEYVSNVVYPDTSKQEATGTLDPYVSPSIGQPTFPGTYAEDLSFESLNDMARIGIRGGVVPTLVAGSTGAYERHFQFNPVGYDVDRLSVEHYVDGLGWKDRGVSFNEWTLSGDVDQDGSNWQMSGPLFIIGSKPMPGDFEGVLTGADATTITMTGAGWTVNQHAGKFVNLGLNHVAPIRQIVSNTADTATLSDPLDVDEIPAAGTRFRIEGKFTSGIARPVVEKIPMRGTRLFMDPVGQIGTTQVRRRFVSFSITTRHNLDTKFFADTPDGEFDRESPGKREITFQVRLELDRRDEYLQLARKQMLSLRILQTGTEIEDGVFKKAQIDLPNASWTGVEKGERKNNLVATFSGRLYTASPIFDLSTVTALA